MATQFVIINLILLKITQTPCQLYNILRLKLEASGPDK